MKRFWQKGWLIGFLMMSFLANSQTKALAQSYRYQYLQTCQQVRSYRTQNNLSDRDLLTLEYQYCVLDNPSYSSRRRHVEPVLVPIPAVSASEDCINATILARLAIAGEPYTTSTSEVAGFQQVVCALPNLPRNNQTTFEWRSGHDAKFGSAWYYPNGKNAKFANSWYYPNGKNAKFGNAWYYPNGESAKFGSTWYFPDGESTDLTSLLSWSCGILGYFDCQDRLADLRSTQGFWYDLTVVELASRAYNELENYHRYDFGSQGDPKININIIIK